MPPAFPATFSATLPAILQAAPVQTVPVIG